MAADAGGTYDDTEGLINLPLTVREIQAAVFFKEIDKHEYRVSMRSKGDIDLCTVAKKFGGGGHKNASGCTVNGPYTEVRARVVREVTRRDRAGLPARAGAIRGPMTSTAAAAADGALVIDKPSGPSSHDIVSAVRRALGGVKVGHTGTLDPLATGVLPLLIGRATRLAQFLASATKTYTAHVQFGWGTDTYDSAGEPTGPPTPAAVDRAALETVLERVPRLVFAAAAGLLSEEGGRAPGLRARARLARRGARTRDGDRPRLTAPRAGRRDCHDRGHELRGILRAIACPRSGCGPRHAGPSGRPAAHQERRVRPVAGGSVRGGPRGTRRGAGPPGAIGSRCSGISRAAG